MEIRHKSNFANEQLRNARRNKFMCELLAAMRRIPIEPPGGAAPPLGDPANPAYSVAISDMLAEQARAKFSAEQEAARLFPSGTGLPSFRPEAVSSGLHNPAQAMISALTVNRKGSVAEGRRSVEEILPKRA